MDTIAPNNRSRWLRRDSSGTFPRPGRIFLDRSSTESPQGVCTMLCPTIAGYAYVAQPRLQSQFLRYDSDSIKWLRYCLVLNSTEVYMFVIGPLKFLLNWYP